jgi:Uma2 family endonuclease
MAGASERHNRIVGNAFFHFRTATRGKTCGVFMADMKLRLMTQNIFYYPDVMLVCDRDDDHPLYKTAPCVLVEVLSPSTATTDKREKWHAYRSLPSLKAYLLVDAEIRRAEYYLREEACEWKHASLEENDVLNLVCGDIRLALTLDDLYEDVDVPVI